MAFDILNAGFAQQSAQTGTNYGAGVIDNPRLLPIFLGSNSGFVFKSGTTTVSDINTSTPPGFVSSNMFNVSALTNVAAVNGSGFLCHVISPQGNASSNQLLEVYVTIDGTQYYFSVPNLSVNDRLILGALIPGGGSSSVSAQTANAAAFDTVWTPAIGSINDAGHVSSPYSKYIYSTGHRLLIPTPHQLATYTMPRVRFEKSLRVDIKIPNPGSASGGSTTAMARYILD